ncbi:MAG: MobA/MobL family protein, partial [Simkaniaceae bacterium]|nr:MobA/MobL family protein [Simkaniaceae bacterium]
MQLYALSQATYPQSPDFTGSSMALAHTRLKVFSRSSRRTVGSLAYRAGVCLLDKETGELHDYSKKQVHSVDLLIPEDAPQWARDLQKKISENRTAGVQELSDIAEAAEKRKDSQVYREYEFSLHRELTDAQNKELALKFLQEHFCSMGMMVKANFHFDVDKEGNRKPHCHAVMLTRRLEENGLSKMKERSWNHKDLATEWRKEFCNYSNAAFKKLGLDIVLDPRTYAEQGINIEPQTKLSRNTLEIEQRHGANPKDILSTPVTTRGQDFQEISLRNLYKIIDNPKIVLEDISKQQMTFMWGDVVKFLARHIDDHALFDRVCLKLQASDELVCIKEGASLSQRVFTTKTRLEEETRFVEGVRSLKDSHTHTVDPEVVQSVIDSTNKGFQERSKDPDASLSNDQVRAIHHMASSNQLSFIEGYAGAGKTTVMRGMKEIWEASGFKVYGLAPTGRASDNLADCGISSQTVDRFL